jgi:hypothetical protein
MNESEKTVLARWDRGQWVGQRGPDHVRPKAKLSRPRWSRWQWVGRSPLSSTDESAEGDSRLSGGGHGPNAHRWYERANER